MSEKPEIYNRQEVAYHKLPKEENSVMCQGRAAECANGSVVEVWSVIDSDDLAIFLRRPLDDGTQSVCSFRMSEQGAAALAVLLSKKLRQEITT